MPMPWEMDWGGTQAAPPPAQAGAKPWEMDWGGESKAASKPQETGIGPAWERIKTWPGRIKDTIISGATLPRDVLPRDSVLGEAFGGKSVDPNSPEGQERLSDTASLIMPGSTLAKAGIQTARGTGLGKKLRPPTANIEAATTAADLGAPLPAGLVSENRGVQGLTQASRSLPLVGAEIDKRVAGTIEAAGGKVGDIAESLSGGIPDRATAGAGLRPSLQGVIADNNGRIDRVYGALRNVIDSDAKGPLTSTSKMLDVVMNERVAAGMKSPDAGLKDIINLVNKGGSFNGLQRARADVGKIIGLAESNPNPGFNVGDFKRIYAAMSGDMENLVRRNAKVHPDSAVSVLREANGAADQLIERNKKVQNLLNIRTDEGLVGGVINAAQDKTGNAKLLMQLRQQMPKADFEQIVGVGLSELGHNPTTGKFSLEKFGTGYRKLGDTAKSVLFPDAAHRKALDDIANLDKVLKDSDKYINKSGTGRVNAITGIIGGLGGALASGNIPAALGGLAAAAGGYGLAKYLGRPATASTLAKWMRTAQNGRTVPGPARQAMLRMASRNLVSNLSDIPGFPKDVILKGQQNPVHAGADNEQPKPRVANVNKNPTQRHRNNKNQPVGAAAYGAVPH